MTLIQRNALVSYTPQQMFELVNNIEDYPRFLPWCTSSHIVFQENNEVEATLEIHWSGFSKSFTTRNQLYPSERIEIRLIKGPFKFLEGRWNFCALGEHACKIQMDLEFELAGSFFDKMFQPVFHHIANSLVDAFCKRAVEVYGVR